MNNTMGTALAGRRDGLWNIIRSTPIIDHHAHPLLRLEAMDKAPLLSVASEAFEDIESARNSLAHFRAVRQLSMALGCEASWESVEAAIGKKRKGNHQEWVARCLSGIECILIDDGLGTETDMTPYNHLDALTPTASKRIVRVEHLAQQLIEAACLEHHKYEKAFLSVVSRFKAEIERAISDPNVAGFKSVICYRTGLAIPVEEDSKKTFAAFDDIFTRRKEPDAQPFKRLQHEGLNEFFVHLTAKAIRDSTGQRKKPIQFHTGLGDNDITLAKASPTHLQPFIRVYPTVPIVLLHSGYPFVRETGYLATVYKNVFADIGEVFPVLSQEGQESVLRHILELCPSSKILWSTDGHLFPETYLLAVTQIREALHKVLSEYVQGGALDADQAIQLVQNILFTNANELYSLGLTLRSPAAAAMQSQNNDNLRLLTHFLEGKDAPKYLSLWWNDVMSAPRMRSIPMRRVWSMLEGGHDFSFGLAAGYSGLMLNDTLVAGATPIGEYRLTPDLGTLRPGPRKNHIMAMSNLREQDGSPVAVCPRSILQRTLDKAASHGLTFDLGLEMELVFARRVDNRYQIVKSPGHNASNVRAFENEEVMAIIDEAVDRLDAAGIYVEMVHAESGPGQYEIILPKAPALQAVEALLYARDIISSCAAARGIRMTVHPKPLAMAAGSASHCHMSISSLAGSDPAVYEPFYAGILKHLRAIVAFTYSSVASYGRAQDSCWAGGTWVTYGSQNREAPLRKILGSHWEMKCIDGLANPYLALAAVLSAGTHGVLDGEKLVWADCTVDPSQLSDEGRRALGIVERIPRSLEESLLALEADEEMRRWMGEALVERYMAVKRAEAEVLQAMSDDDRNTWIIDRF